VKGEEKKHPTIGASYSALLPCANPIMTEIFDDIKNKYIFEAPCAELTPFVEYYWESSVEWNQSGGNLPFTIKLFPSWTPTISFNLGSPYELSLGKDHFVMGSNSDVLSFRNDVASYKYYRDNYKFGVKFFPGSLSLLLHMDTNILTGKLVPLKKVLPPSLIEKVKASPSFLDRVALLQDYFLSCLQKITGRNNSFKFNRIVEAIDVQYDNLTSKNYEIAAQVFTTKKTLYRDFTSVIGATPKQYFCVVRARAALQTYVKQKGSFEPLDFGYYDWSHFHKAVFKFTGTKLEEKCD
jgi:AraC-like DNA-binding protein